LFDLILNCYFEFEFEFLFVNGINYSNPYIALFESGYQYFNV